MPNIRVGNREYAVSDAEAAAFEQTHRPGAVTEVAPADLAGRAMARTTPESTKGALGYVSANLGEAINTFTGGLAAPLLPDETKLAMAHRDTTLGTIAGFVPGLFTGGAEASLGRAALGGVPGLAAKAGGAVAGRVAGVGGRVLGSALEGGILGAGSTVSRAALSDDPVTIESALADVGIGALLNVGLSELGRGLVRGGTRMGERIAREDAEVAAREAIESIGPSYGAVRSEMKAVRSQAKQMAAEAEQAIATARASVEDAPRAAAEAVRNAAAANAERIGVIARAEGASRSVIDRAQQAKAEIDKLLSSGAVDEAATIANRLGDDAYAGHQRVGDIMGLGPVPTGGYRVPTVAEHQAKARAALQAAEQAASQAPRPIPKLPKTVDEFARLQPKTVESLDAAIAADTTGRSREALDGLAKELGIVIEGGDTPLAAIHKHLRAGVLPPGVNAAKKPAGGWLKRAMRSGIRSGVGRAADRAVGGGVPGGVVRSLAAGGAAAVMGGVPGMLVAAEVSGARHAVQSRIRRAIASIAPRVGRATQKMSPAMTRLFMTPDGEAEKGAPHEIALRKFDEVARTAVAAPDAAFEAVRHVIPASPNAAAAMQRKAIDVANYLVASMPKDPGTAQAQFKSFWRPTNEQIQKFADRHFAATDPLGAIEHLAEGNVNVEMAESLRQNWPALFEQFRTELVQAIPEMPPLSHGQLMAFSVMLQQPLHGLQTPENIAYFQAEVHGPKAEAPPPRQPSTFTPGAPPSRSTSAGATAGMTQAQRLQNR